MREREHVRTRRQLKCLHSVLTEWTRLNRYLGRHWIKNAKDLPWWYNERALMSLFVGAVWRTKGHAFEEISDFKVKGSRRKQSNGRVDLMFERRGHEFRAEVKHGEIPITNRAAQERRLKDLMTRAVEDARCNPADGYSRRLAIAFAVPYVSSKTSIEKREEQIEWFQSLVRAIPHDAVAWTFPNVEEFPVLKGWVCPGIAVLIKIVHRSR